MICCSVSFSGDGRPSTISGAVAPFPGISDCGDAGSSFLTNSPLLPWDFQSPRDHLALGSICPKILATNGEEKPGQGLKRYPPLGRDRGFSD
jgi:hypothetical protein